MKRNQNGNPIKLHHLAFPFISLPSLLSLSLSLLSLPQSPSPSSRGTPSFISLPLPFSLEWYHITNHLSSQVYKLNSAHSLTLLSSFSLFFLLLSLSFFFLLLSLSLSLSPESSLSREKLPEYPTNYEMERKTRKKELREKRKKELREKRKVSSRTYHNIGSMDR